MALPITAIVYIMALTPLFDFSTAELIPFSVSAVLLVLGIGLFNLGADMAMTPMGTHVGAGLCVALQGESAVLRDAFGVVALVAMIPLITIQLLGFRSILDRRVKELRAMKRIMDADDQQIINFM